jgi:MFS family permease
MGVVFVAAFNWQVLLPLYATRDLNGDAGTFGVLMSVFGVGSLIGALVMAGRSGSPNARRLAVLGIVLGALTGVVAATASKPIAYASMPFLGAVGIGFAIAGNSTLQLESSATMRGRVMALYSVILLGSTPIGGPIAGWVAERLGARAGLAMGAVVAAAAGLWALVNLRTRGEEPGSGFDGDQLETRRVDEPSIGDL